MSDRPGKCGPERDDPLERLRQFERERGLDETSDEGEPPALPAPEEETDEEDEDAGERS